MSDKHKITIDEVRHLALLTRINMTEDEIELMRGQMSDILDRLKYSIKLILRESNQLLTRLVWIRFLEMTNLYHLSQLKTPC
ncbi:MAG: hypothetical protein CM1200mP3_15130 [Chloroflexota bacterium]|nr:MAG: hypothetical protein CM1200mP3_15130 [Chloroflexota bacterium]